jgi:hypothetical protein|nr:MAG TPA: hypothetical protein [Caudoviricetes sp.]
MAKKKYKVIDLTKELMDHLKTTSGVIIKEETYYKQRQYVVYDKDLKKGILFARTKDRAIELAKQYGVKAGKISYEC